MENMIFVGFSKSSLFTSYNWILEFSFFSDAVIYSLIFVHKVVANFFLLSVADLTTKSTFAVTPRQTLLYEGCLKS
jgi:hypothetical protein